MKIIGILLACVVSFLAAFSSFATPQYSKCEQAVPTTDPNFCASFQEIAFCHCAEMLPKTFCTDMTTLYNRMITMFGSIEKACKWQKDTSVQNCMDNWNCYRNGGKNSQGGLCSSTGKACTGTVKRYKHK